jgi:hypothetical protein
MGQYYYRITVILRDGKKMEGLREHTSEDIGHSVFNLPAPG